MSTHCLPALSVLFGFFLFFSVFPNLTEFVAPWWPVYSDLHARAGAGGRLPLPDWLRTLFLLLAQGRLWPVPCLPGERVSAPSLSRLRPLCLSTNTELLLFLLRSSSVSTFWCWCCAWSWTGPTSFTTLCHWSPSGLWSSTPRWPPGRRSCRSRPTVGCFFVTSHTFLQKDDSCVAMFDSSPVLSEQAAACGIWASR